LETYITPKELIENRQYQAQRQKQLAGLADSLIDAPIAGLVNRINRLPYCFTLQSCYGHFICNGQNNPSNHVPLPPAGAIARVEYRIAYIAFCIENSDAGKSLLADLARITTIDPKNIQLCCAEWFWERQVNSYALQVEPDRFKHRDSAILGYREAQQIEKTRDEFYARLSGLFRKLEGMTLQASTCLPGGVILNSSLLANISG
jgi:hypothetical protein